MVVVKQTSRDGRLVVLVEGRPKETVTRRGQRHELVGRFPLGNLTRAVYVAC